MSTRRRKEVADICAGDCCQMAVTRAFREMQELGKPDQFAYEAALTVFRWHHPEIATQQARNIVDIWVGEGTIH
ncbi:MAG: hypothetical protein AB7H77_04040 [Bdellovibrionales bacterium]